MLEIFENIVCVRFFRHSVLCMVHSSQALKLLEFSFKTSERLKVLETDKDFENVWKVLEFLQTGLKKLHMHRRK